MSLPVMKIARAAYASVMADPASLAAIALPWFAIEYFLRYVVSFEPFVPHGAVDRMITSGILVAAVLSMGLIFAYAGFVVAWTRWVMLREPPPARFVPQIGPRELRCVGIIFACGAIALVVALPAAAAALLLGRAMVVAATIGVLLMGVRFSFAVPMAALDGPRGLLRASWGLTSGMTLRLLLLTAVVVAPIAALEALVGLAAPDGWAVRGSLQWYAFGLITSAITLLGSAVLASAYAFALSAIGDGPAEPDPTARP